MSSSAVHSSPDHSLPPAVGRVDAIDILRGLVMVIMALDHARDYFTHLRFPPEDLTQTYGALFFTRWITHFCAPTFFFLAGTGIFLSRKRGAELSKFLFTRGLWLVFLEMTVVGFGWTFQLPAAPFFGLLVIWALGWSMIAMAAICRLPVKAIAAIGVGMIALHNLLDPIRAESFTGAARQLWGVLHQSGFYPIGAIGPQGPAAGIFVLYPLVPWIGVMAAGYAFGAIVKLPADERRKWFLRIGLGAIAAFIVLRATNLYGNPPLGQGFVSPGGFATQSTPMLTVISFLNAEKYPPSLQYLLMTLGPAILSLLYFDRVDARAMLGRFWEKIKVIGKVPMFYYILHIYLLHAMAVVAAFAFRQPTDWVINGGFIRGIEPGYGHNLPFIYLMWVVAVVILYFPCKWYAGVKARSKNPWLSYL